jgi:hypothetical protein
MIPFSFVRFSHSFDVLEECISIELSFSHRNSLPRRAMLSEEELVRNRCETKILKSSTHVSCSRWSFRVDSLSEPNLSPVKNDRGMLVSEKAFVSS